VIPLFELSVGAEEKREVMAALDANWITEAVKTREFERAFAGFVGAAHATAVTSGTVAIAVALMALDIGRGDEVIVPDVTMAGTANGVLLAGATPVFADVQASTGSLGPADVEPHLTSRTKAVIAVHLNGRPADVYGLSRLCADAGITFIEDAAQAIGCTVDGRSLGTFGRVGCFSLATTKTVTTGQGGVVVTSDAGIRDRLTRAKDHGRLDRSRDFHDAIGFNFKFTDIQAGIGLAQLRSIDARIARKRALYGHYASALQDTPGVKWLPTDLTSVTPWLVDIYVDDPDALSQDLQRRGVGSRRVYPPLHTQPCYRHLTRGAFPVAGQISASGLWLPSGVTLSDEQIDDVCTAVRSCLEARV
jgi:perosamine synthetase